MAESPKKPKTYPRLDKNNYQFDFYESCDKVRDPEARRKIAEKIEFIINHLLCADTEEWVCLDLGSSSGMVTQAVAHHFSQVVGLDIDRAALSAGKQNQVDNYGFLQGDAMRLPFANSVFDLIFCLQVYEHVPDDVQLFREIRRVIKPGGIVLFSGPNFLFPIEPHYNLPFLHWLPSWAADRYLRITGKGKVFYERSRSYWSLRRLMNGFRIEDITFEVAMFRIFGAPRSSRSLHSPVWHWLSKPFIPLLPNFNWILKYE